MPNKYNQKISLFEVLINVCWIQKLFFRNEFSFVFKKYKIIRINFKKKFEILFYQKVTINEKDYMTQIFKSSSLIPIIFVNDKKKRK